MGRKFKRLRLQARIERLREQSSQPSPVVENSVMQERVKKEVPSEEKVDVATDTNFTPDIVKEMIEEMVEELRPEPKPKAKPKAKRTPPRRNRNLVSKNKK